MQIEWHPLGIQFSNFTAQHVPEERREWHFLEDGKPILIEGYALLLDGPRYAYVQSQNFTPVSVKCYLTKDASIRLVLRVNFAMKHHMTLRKVARILSPPKFANSPQADVKYSVFEKAWLLAHCAEQNATEPKNESCFCVCDRIVRGRALIVSKKGVVA